MYVGEVLCADGDVRLAGGPNEFEGRVEVCRDGGWVQVCGNGDWGPIPGNVVCNHTANCKSSFGARCNTNIED